MTTPTTTAAAETEGYLAGRALIADLPDQIAEVYTPQTGWHRLTASGLARLLREHQEQREQLAALTAEQSAR